MRRSHRFAHRLLWPLLAVLVVVGVVMALVLRPPPEEPAVPTGRDQANPMSAGYQAVQWNARKVIYDAVALAAIVIFINGAIAIGKLSKSAAFPNKRFISVFNFLASTVKDFASEVYFTGKPPPISKTLIFFLLYLKNRFLNFLNLASLKIDEEIFKAWL